MGEETWGDGEGRRARALVCACVYASNECVHRIRASSGERGRKPGIRGMPKDPPRTKWSPLILRRHCKVHPSSRSSSSSSDRFFLVLSLSLFPLSLSFVSPLLSPSLACSLTLSLSLFFTLCLLPSVQVFPHANAKSTELLGIIAAPGLDSRREYISSTLVGKLCLWSGTGRRRYSRWEGGR